MKEVTKENLDTLHAQMTECAIALTKATAAFNTAVEDIENDRYQRDLPREWRTVMHREFVRLGCWFKGEREHNPEPVYGIDGDTLASKLAFLAHDPTNEDVFVEHGLLTIHGAHMYWEWMAKHYPHVSEPWAFSLEVLQSTGPDSLERTDKRLGYAIDQLGVVFQALRALPDDSGFEVVWEMLENLPHAQNLNAWFDHLKVSDPDTETNENTSY